MAKDGFSHSDQRLAVAGPLGRKSNDRRLGTAVGSLTQELAQLLADLITQNKANKGGAPTNDELASLANLVSAAGTRRTIPPASKQSLSTLSYRQPAAAPSLERTHDDEPMPIPSTWREPLARYDDRWFHQHLSAAIPGLIAGLTLVVPALLWLSGFCSPQRLETVAARAVPAIADTRTAPNPGPVEGKSPPLVPIIAAARPIDPKQPHIDKLLAQTAERIESGDVAGARELLAGADDGEQGAVSFALAETYDPNMLAAWGTRGMAADATKARSLYRKAFGLGVARAQNRLDALRP